MLKRLYLALFALGLSSCSPDQAATVVPPQPDAPIPAVLASNVVLVPNHVPALMQAATANTSAAASSVTLQFSSAPQPGDELVCGYFSPSSVSDIYAPPANWSIQSLSTNHGLSELILTHAVSSTDGAYVFSVSGSDTPTSIAMACGDYSGINTTFPIASISPINTASSGTMAQTMSLSAPVVGARAVAFFGSNARVNPTITSPFHVVENVQTTGATALTALVADTGHVALTTSSALSPVVTWSASVAASNGALVMLTPAGINPVPPSPTATPTVSPSPSPTPTVTSSPTPSATPTVSPSPSPTPTPTMTPSPTPSPTATPTATPTPTPSPTATPTPTPSPTASPAPTPTSSPTMSPTPTPSPTASPTPTPTPMPSATPALVCSPPFLAPGSYPDDCFQPYASTSVFNQPSPAPGASVDANSATWNSYYTGAGFPYFTSTQFGYTNQTQQYQHPIYFGNSGNSLYTINSGTCPAGYGDCSGSYHGPSYMVAAGGSDHHMTLIDQTTNTELDCYAVTGVNNTTHVISASNCDHSNFLTGDGLYGEQTHSGFALWAGAIRAQELIEGQINHALFVVAPCTSTTEVFPSYTGTGTDTECTGNQGAPYGGWIRLNMTAAQITASGAPTYIQTIMTALRVHGGFIGDTNGNSQFSLQVEADSTYTAPGYTNTHCPTTSPASGIPCTPLTAFEHAMGDPDWSSSGYYQLNVGRWVPSADWQWLDSPPGS